MLPLSKPLLAVIALMYGIGQWNPYFSALIYLRNEDLYPLQLVLRNILILNNTPAERTSPTSWSAKQLADLMKFSLIVVSTVPGAARLPVRRAALHQGRDARLRQGLIRRALDSHPLQSQSVPQ